jgi:hypothetical protein
VTLIRDSVCAAPRDRETEFGIAVRCHGVRGEPSRSKYLVMDNASIHKGPAVTAALAALNVEPVFLPPYSPELNSCEVARVARAPQLAEGAVTQVRAGSLQQQKRRQRKQQRDQLATRAGAPEVVHARLTRRFGPRGSGRSRVLGRLADVQHSNVAASHRKCAWGNVVEDLRGDFLTSRAPKRLKKKQMLK